MGKFIPTTRRNGECEICGNTSGKCRRLRQSDIHLCMTFADARQGNVQNGYKCIKADTKGKGWATFKLDNSEEWTPQQRQQWKAEAQQRRQQQAAIDANRQARSLEAVERDRLYRQLLAELSLHPDDRADLIRRGLTVEQIELGGFRSVERYQQLQRQYPKLLPGISGTGRSLVNTHAGYLCPVRNKDGLIVACQIRLRVLQAGDKNRYRWLSEKEGRSVLHVFRPGSDPAGELPLAVCRPLIQAVGMALAEGTGTKLLITSQRLNLIAIGAAGGQWASSPVIFRETIDQIAAELNTKLISLFPDAGDVRNSRVMSRWARVVALLKSWGFTVQIAWWGQTSKQDSCDLDELAPEQLQQITYISPTEFAAIASEQGGVKSTCSGQGFQAKVETVPEQPSGEAWNFWHEARRFTTTPERVLNQRFFYAPVPQLGTLTGVRSGTGTGKTHWTIDQAINSLTRLHPDLGFLSVGYRNTNLIQFAEEELLEGNWYHLQRDLKGKDDRFLIRDLSSRILCCIDSLIYFAPQDFNGRIVLLDEIESVLKQLFQGDTAVAYQRERIKDLFVEMLQRASLIICLDGHLKDETIEYLHSLCGNKTIVKYHNTYTGNKGKVEFLLGTGDGEQVQLNDYSPAIHAIRSNPNCIVVASDGQEQIENLDRELTAQGRKTFRFDSRTANKPEMKAFLANPAQYIREHGIEVLLYSPSAEAGLNIDIKGYFSDLYFLFFGVITTDAQLQMLARVRDPDAMIHVWCAVQGFPSNCTSKSALPNQLKAEVLEYVCACAMRSLSGLTKDDEALKLAHKIIALSDNQHFDFEARLLAIENHERTHLRVCLREALTESGYQVEAVYGETASLKALKANRETARVEKSAQIYQATDITTAEADTKARNFGCTEQERDQIARRRLLDRLPGIEAATYREVVPVSVTPASSVEPPAVSLPDEAIAAPPNPTTVEEVEKPVFTPELIKFLRWEDKAFISKLERHWLIEHPDQVRHLQQMRWHKRLVVFTDAEEPDCNKRLSLSHYRSRLLEIERLIEQGIGFFLQPGAQWSAKTPEAITFWQQGQQAKFSEATGKAVGRSSPCTYISNLLRTMLGLKTASKYDHTLKTRIYWLAPTSIDSPIRAALFQSVGMRFEQVLTQDKAVLDWERFNLPVPIAAAMAQSQAQVEPPSPTRSPSANFVLKNQKADQTAATQPTTAAATSCTNSIRVESPVQTTLSTPEEAKTLAGLLSRCEDIDALAEVRKSPGLTRELWQAAGRLLTKLKRSQVRQWMRQLLNSGQFGSSSA